MENSRDGFLAGVGAYALWGIFPIYWTLLEPSLPFELLAHRIAWSALTMIVVVLAMKRVPALREIVVTPRERTFLTLAAVVITINWGTYIWGVNNGLVLETSLGYFINPLVTVLFGVVLLGERLRWGQWVALAIAFGAVVVLTVGYGRPPWVALILAFSFGTYGLAKKQAGVEPIASMAYETLLITPVALAYLLWLGLQGRSTFLSAGGGHTALLLSTGIVTAIPLLLFGYAAIRVGLVTLGLLQYLAPIFQFLLGLVWFHEHMPVERWVGFGLVWVALVILTVESLTHRRRTLRASPTP